MNDKNLYLCKDCGKNVCFEDVKLSLGCDFTHDLVYVGTSHSEEEFEAYYYTHMGLFTV